VETAREASREQKVAGLEAFFDALGAVVLTITGSAEDTLSRVATAADTLRRAERAELREALRALGFVHRVRGSLDAARRVYEEALALGERDATIGLALVDLAGGRFTAAAPVLEQALAAVPPEQPLLVRRLVPHVVEALIATDRIAEAAAIAERERIPDDARAGAVELRYATGLVRLAQRNPASARQALAAAAAAWDALGNVVEGARARVALLDATLAAGDAAEGATLGRHLVEQLERLSMPRERNHVRRLLRRAGIRTRPTARPRTDERSGVAPLTSREEAVLLEVALGRTNREIAATLGISEKTVGVHVSHILEKLGCRTRTQAARFAPR
jgi:DNA-binding CsgD family transcriptional regulator